MTFPFFATPYPDATASGPILGAEQRAIVSRMVRHPGRVLSMEELGAGLTPMSRTPRRMQTLIDGIRATLGPDIVIDVPRRGWMYAPTGVS